MGEERGTAEGCMGHTDEHLPSVLTGISERGPRVQEQRKQASRAWEVGEPLGGGWAGVWAGVGPDGRTVCPLHWALSQAFPVKDHLPPPPPQPLGQLGATSHCSTDPEGIQARPAWALTSGRPH